ncbi:MAG TPA: hypothetical protein VH062_30195 [Polyangiaceae bacterium]|jgi:hypothetical protein|nr:hypothetical protein [Polyangiaceae bacterium]
MSEVVPSPERGLAKPEVRPVSRVLRVASFIAAFAVTSLAVWQAGAYAVQVAKIPRPSMTLDLVPRLRLWSFAMQRDRAPHKVAMMGDSMIFTEWPGTSMPSWVQRELDSRQDAAHRSGVHVLSWAAWGPAPEYCMVDDIAKAKPDLLVLEVNLRLLGPAPLGIVSYTELSGHIANSRIPEAAMLPLSHAGITMSRLLFYRLIVLTKHERHFSDILQRQAMLFNVRGPLEEWLDEKTKSRQFAARKWAWGLALSGRLLEEGTTRSRDNKQHALDALGDVIGGIGEGHPRLVVLGAMIRDFEKQGIPVLVWVSPINVEHLKKLGLPTDGIGRSMQTIRKVVEGNGARLVDLHRLLPDDAFVDSGDHYTREGYPNGAEVVGRALGEAVALEEERLALQ